MNKLSGKVKCSCKCQAMSSNQNHLVSFNKLKRVVNAVNYLKMNPIIILTKIDSTFAIKTTLFPNTCDLFFLKHLSLVESYWLIACLQTCYPTLYTSRSHIEFFLCHCWEGKKKQTTEKKNKSKEVLYQSMLVLNGKNYARLLE